MRTRMAAIVGGVLLAASQVLAQGRMADAPAGEPIDDPSKRPAQRAELPQGRQSNWVDENAIAAGGRVAPNGAPPGLQDQASPSAPEIRSYVATLANATLSPGGIRKAVEMLSNEDRQRLGKEVREEDAKAYDELVQQFRAQWKARYGEDFDLARQSAVVADYYVLRGPQPDDAITVGGNVGSPAQANGRADGQMRVPQRAGEERMATMVVPTNPQTQQPAMMLQLRNEPGGKPADWRLNTPRSLTGDRLCQNLQGRIRKMLDGQAQWPANARDGYRTMSYHVLASLADQPLDRPKQPSQQPQQPANPDNPSLES